MPQFQGKTALVTGAASGIGAACVDWLLAQGIDRFILVDLHTERLHAVAPQCKVFGGDVADPGLWQQVEKACGNIDFAVLNAGVAASGSIMDLDFDQWRSVMATNLDGMALSLHCAMRGMRERGGSIVLTASVSGIKAEPGTAAYGASKAGVIQLAKVAAKEGTPLGIRVNAVAPGGVDTPIWDQVPMFAEMAAGEGGRDGAIATMCKLATPLGRFAQAEEVAAQFGFLLSDAAATITGTVLVSDGGYSL